MSAVNLMNLYWKSGVFKPDNDTTVTEYIQAAACDQYRKKFKDDFAWPEMIKQTRDYVTRFRKNFTTMFWVVQPIALGRYIPDQQIFQISEDTQYRNVRRMVFADFTGAVAFCPGTSPPTSAPMRAEISLGRGFSITQIPMDHDFARATIDFIDNRLKRMEIIQETRDRFAYVKFYFTVQGYQKIEEGAGVRSAFKGPSVAFSGTIDGYEIYADDEANYLLYRWVNTDKEK